MRERWGGGGGGREKERERERESVWEKGGRHSDKLRRTDRTDRHTQRGGGEFLASV